MLTALTARVAPTTSSASPMWEIAAGLAAWSIPVVRAMMPATVNVTTIEMRAQ